MQRWLVSMVVGTLIGVGGACGGTVVIDGDTGSGGATGAGKGTTNSIGSGATNPLCATPDPEGTLLACELGSSNPNICNRGNCDDANNVWQSRCEGNSCDCIYNTTLRCTCLLNADVDICADDLPSCCPAPYPQ